MGAKTLISGMWNKKGFGWSVALYWVCRYKEECEEVSYDPVAAVANEVLGSFRKKSIFKTVLSL